MCSKKIIKYVVKVTEKEKEEQNIVKTQLSMYQVGHFGKN